MGPPGSCEAAAPPTPASGARGDAGDAVTALISHSGRHADGSGGVQERIVLTVLVHRPRAHDEPAVAPDVDVVVAQPALGVADRLAAVVLAEQDMRPAAGTTAPRVRDDHPDVRREDFKVSRPVLVYDQQARRPTGDADVEGPLAKHAVHGGRVGRRPRAPGHRRVLAPLAVTRRAPMRTPTLGPPGVVHREDGKPLSSKRQGFRGRRAREFQALDLKERGGVQSSPLRPGHRCTSLPLSSSARWLRRSSVRGGAASTTRRSYCASASARARLDAGRFVPTLMAALTVHAI